jgi:hypothetical protein
MAAPAAPPVRREVASRSFVRGVVVAEAAVGAVAAAGGAGRVPAPGLPYPLVGPGGLADR